MYINLYWKFYFIMTVIIFYQNLLYNKIYGKSLPLYSPSQMTSHRSCYWSLRRSRLFIFSVTRYSLKNYLKKFEKSCPFSLIFYTKWLSSHLFSCTNLYIVQQYYKSCAPFSGGRAGGGGIKVALHEKSKPTCNSTYNYESRASW